MLFPEKIKMKISSSLSWPLRYIYRKTRSLPQDLPVILSFLFHSTVVATSFFKRFFIILQCYKISYFVDCPHMESEIIKVISTTLSFDSALEGVIVEAGSYKGGSAAKISLAAEIANRKLIVFDSFKGLPKHNEIHGKNIYGGDAYFPAGSYRGTLDEVRENIKKFGKIEYCEFVKGWFENTMPIFKKPVVTAYIDVDLASSTKTCLRYLYPVLVKRGIIFSQDGHLPWIVDVLSNDDFWKKEVHYPRPEIKELGEKKLVEIQK